MTRNVSMVSAWLGGLAVWGIAMAGLAAMPNPHNGDALAAVIQNHPSEHVLAINEHYVEMGLLDPSEREADVSAAPSLAPKHVSPSLYAASDSTERCPLQDEAQS